MRIANLTISFAVAAGAIMGSALPARAATQPPQDFPTKPLRLIVPFPPGGGNDILARSVGTRLSTLVNQQVVVDNRGGAGGLIGAELAAKANPDGHTLFLGSVGNLAHIPALQANLPYDPVRDFAPVTLLANSAFVVVVNPSLPVRSIKELIALAKAKPGTLNYASAGPGSSLHMTAEIFKHATGANLVHVPYKGASAGFTDLIAGQVQVMFSTIAPAVPQIKSGKLRALAVTTAKRAAVLPEIPTVAESGVPGFEVSNWQGIVAPRATPAPIVKRLNEAFLETLKMPATAETLTAQGLDPAGSTPEQFGALIRSEIAKYKALVRQAQIRID